MSSRRAVLVTAAAAALGLVAVACVPAPPPWTGDSPSGALDAVTVVSNSVSVRGWAGDRDSAAPIDVVLVAGGTAIGVVTADGDRPDVAATTSREGRFGFAATFDAPSVGAGTPVCAVALNVGAGSNAVIGCRDATVAPSTPSPTPIAPPQPPTTTPGPDPRLDQVQELAGGPGSLGCPGSIVAGQTFTAGRAGELEQIDLLVSTPGRARLGVELRATVAGRPDGELLATAIVDTEVDGDPAWVSAVFDDPVHVVDGVQYGFMVLVSDDCDADVQVFGQGPDPYPGGISWISDVDDRSVLIDDEPVDLAFRTFVSVATG